MQTNDKPSGPDSSLTHPSETEWMEFLYEEAPPSRKGELQKHLRECAACAAQVRSWKKGMEALDSWRPVAADVPKAPWQPVLRWAAAAVLVLTLGVVLGRTTNNSNDQLRDLQASVSRLNQIVGQAPKPANDQNAQIVAAATRAAAEETFRVLNDYTRVLDQHYARDRETTAAAILTLQNRINTVRAELETVAVNTQDGLQETHQSLAQLVLASRNPESPIPTNFDRNN